MVWPCVSIRERQNADGRIESEGSYAELMSNGALEALLEECEKEAKKEDDDEDADGGEGQARDIFRGKGRIQVILFYEFDPLTLFCVQRTWRTATATASSATNCRPSRR